VTVNISNVFMSDWRFIDLCAGGDLQKVQQYYLSNVIDIHAVNDYAFQTSCHHGHIEVAKWLLDISNNKLYSLDGVVSNNGRIESPVNIHANNDSAFRCCGHFEIAKWLHSLGGVDIHAKNDEAFLYSCYKGQIEMAKWLYSLGAVVSNTYRIESAVNIHTDDTYDAFGCSCRSGHIEIIIFLLTIYNKYNYIHTIDNIATKLLFDLRTDGKIGNNIKLTTELTDKYTILKQSIMSEITEHLIPDIATIIYYYV
jgi:hypothetical protein